MELRKQSPDLHSSLAQQALVDAVDGSGFFEETDGDSLSAIQHFCASSQAYQRLAYAQGIAAAAAVDSADYEQCVEVLLPCVQQLSRDPEAEIRGTAVKQLSGLGTALFGKDAERSMRDIEATLLVCAQQCALDDEDEVNQAAILAFQQLVQLLPSARATAASKRAVDRLESQGSDDGTLAGVRLLAHSVAFWTPEALKRHVPRYISRWASHREFSVREATATCMSLVVPAMPLRLCHQVLLPAFYQLSRDQNWRVRRACALDLPRLAAALQSRPADASTPTADQASSSSNWQQEVEADQPLGCCSSRPSSCLATMQRYTGDLSGSQLVANLAAASGPQRNRSYPSLANRLPATTAEIMTKHPMHSSLIMDGLLSGSSSCASMPGSPSGSSDALSSAHDGHDEVCSSHTHHHHQHHQQQRGSMSDSEQRDHHDQAPCGLEQHVPLLHDCWCALRQCMELLTADSSHWVKVAALSGLGPFLLQLPPCQLGQLLLGRFTSMAGSTVVIYEVSVALACAQAFGQLAVLLGPDRWADMRDAWHALQASRDPAVLCEVVNCLPQLMAALGPVLTHRDVCPALAGLVQSHLSWIGGQLVQVMADLLTHLPPTGHELLLKTLPQLASNGDRNRSWRVRRDLALQLGRLATAAGPDAIENSIWPTAMSLCCDPIAAVRTAAASQIGPILAALPSHMLQSQDEDAADRCAACSNSRLGSAHMSCPPSNWSSLTGCTADLQAGAAAAAIPGAAADATPAGDSISFNSHIKAGSTRDSLDGFEAAGGSAPISIRRSKSGSSRSRSGSFGVRFALDDTTSSGGNSSRANAISSSPKGNAVDQQGPSRPSVLSEFMEGQRSSSVNDRINSSSLDFDELELPSALAPAPAGCFSAHSDSGDESDSDHAAADGSGSSGLSSSSSRSSDSGSHHSDSSSSSSSDESGNESDSESEDEGNSSPGAAGSQRWRGVASTEEQQGASSSSSEREGTPVPEAAVAAPAAADSAAESPTSAPAAEAAPPTRPLYAMHPAMMPVGALSAASAAAGAASLPVPVTRRRAVPSRARSTGDLLRLQTTVSALNPEDSTLGGHRDGVVGRFKQQHGVRQLADSLPNGLLASSSEEDLCRDSSSGGWAGGLPQPAHAAPHQYLPVLVEYFGCSSSHQQRQLFVPLVMGLLACCHKVLACSQQAVLLDRLEALAHDNVPGVRYAVAAALADVRVQAAALTGQQQQQRQEQESGQEQQGVAVAAEHAAQEHSQQHAAGCMAAETPSAQQPEAVQSPEGAANGAAAACSVSEQPQPGQQDTAYAQQQQQQQQQQDVKPAEDTVSPRDSEEPVTQLVGHVPKGAHPLLGYQAYVQQLARTTSRDASTICTPPKASSGGGSSSCDRTSPSGKGPAPAAVANGRVSSALPPRSGSSPASASRQMGRQSSTGRQQQQPAGLTSVKTKGTGATRAVGAGQQGGAAGAAAGAGAQRAGAGADDTADAAEWLMKLSNCKQLERLMHVVALTTGPL